MTFWYFKKPSICYCVVLNGFRREDVSLGWHCCGQRISALVRPVLSSVGATSHTCCCVCHMATLKEGCLCEIHSRRYIHGRYEKKKKWGAISWQKIKIKKYSQGFYLMFSSSDQNIPNIKANRTYEAISYTKGPMQNQEKALCFLLQKQNRRFQRNHCHHRLFLY